MSNNEKRREMDAVKVFAERDLGEFACEVDFAIQYSALSNSEVFKTIKELAAESIVSKGESENSVSNLM